MASKLKEPHEYAAELDFLNAQRPARGLPVIAPTALRLERKANRHPETSGRPWGWYEVFPLNITVGYWGSDKDDLRGVDINAWNEGAKKASKRHG